MFIKKTLRVAQVSRILSLFTVTAMTSFYIQAQEDKPDFSGVWTMYFEPGVNAFAGFGAPVNHPFTEEGKRLSEEFEALVGPTQDNSGAFCVGYGMPTMMVQAGGYPLEIIQRPDQITIIYEVEGETRRIYFEDRALPEERRFPNRQGYSVGHWEGDTLVVEVTSMTDAQDQPGHPHSDQARIIERYNLDTDHNGTTILAYEFTMTDPVYYTEPVTYSKKMAPLEDGQILPYNCTEEPWLKLLNKRREQLHAGEPVTATMAEIYETEMYPSE